MVDCLMQVYRIGFLVTSLPVNCNHKSTPYQKRAAIQPAKLQMLRGSDLP